MSARAGWYPDPAGRPEHYRWWDGSAWTRALTTDPAAPAPDLAGIQTHPTPDNDGPAPVPRHQATGPTSWQQAGSVVAAETQTARGSRPPGYERPPRSADRRRSSLRMALLGVGIAALVVAVVVAIAVSGNQSTPLLEPPPPGDDSSSASPSPEPTATASEAVNFDPVSRKFVMDGLMITLPAAPYKLTQLDSGSLGGQGVVGEVAVHKNYDGNGRTWYAVVSVGRVGEDWTGKDLNSTADKIISNWAATEFVDTKVTIKNEEKSTVTKGEPRPARIITADLHYSVKGVKSKYDHVSLLVSKGPSGQYVAFISSRPNDADAKIKNALQASINTVHLI